MRKFLVIGGAAALGITALLLLLARRAPAPATVGSVEGRLRPCPATPNCVSSQAARESQRVAPLAVPAGEAPSAAFERLLGSIAGRSDAEIATRSPEGAAPAWAHAVFVTRLIGFRDDVELLLDEEARVVHVRSASRVGRSDLGANRARVEALRAAFAAGAPGSAAAPDAP